MRALRLTPVFALLVGCSSEVGSGGSGGAGGTGGTPITGDFQAGGDRPVTVLVPSSYDPETPAPLLILLHGYSASGSLENIYLDLDTVAEEKGLIYAYPDGTTNSMSLKFWNATDACCDFEGSGVDDVAYLLGLVDEIAGEVNVDPKRIYFAGHSNGGFMTYRMACEASDRIAAIMSLAGDSWADDADCGATSPVSVVQLQGTADDTILYDGGTTGLVSYPGVETSVGYWATRGGCTGMLSDTGATKDLDANVPGAETHVLAWDGCPPGLAYEVWRMEGSTHIPGITKASGTWVDWLLAHPKP